MKNENKLNVSIDIGGTHSRLQCEVVCDDKILSRSVEYIRNIGDKDSLKRFVKESISDFSPELQPSNCVVGFAGAVIDRRKVSLTNWKNRPAIYFEDLVDCGFSERSTLMVNDMELAAYGILDMDDKKLIPSKQCYILYKPEKVSANHLKNKLVIAPGTGFGTSSIVESKTRSEEIISNVISSEIQHIQIPDFDAKHRKIIEIVLAKMENSNFLSYEDFVSGKGLEDTYKALLQIEGKETNEKTAEDIAGDAVTNSDPIAKEALEVFYRCTGRLVQAMCLVIQPYEGVFLCGASTINNSSFISRSGFMRELHNSKVRKQLLIRFLVYIVTKPDINIAGGLWACRNIL
ncbi:MAG: glucokinase [Armatimonadetes bacterium]|nr:glucokinase [Armatimonadota bacterium]